MPGEVGLQTRTRSLDLMLLVMALLGPALYLTGISTRGLSLLDSDYLRLGLIHLALALSAASAVFLALTPRNLILRLAAGAALLANLGSIAYVGSSWAHSMQRAFKEAEMTPLDPSQVGILVSPADNSAEETARAQAIGEAILQAMQLGEADDRVVVRSAYPLLSEAQAKRLGRQLRANVVVWKESRESNTRIAETHHVTVLGASETDFALDPLQLMLVMATEDTLTFHSSRAPGQEGVSGPESQLVVSVATGFGFLAMGRPMNAAARFKGALALPGISSEALSSLNNYYGVTLLLCERPDLALEAYNRSNQASPNTAAWVGVGNVAAARHEWDVAADAYGRAVALGPYEPSSYCGLGIVLARRRQIQQAILSYEQAIALDPSRGVPYALIGLAHEMDGNIEAARQAYQRCAVNAGPNAGLYAAVLRRAEEIQRHPPTAVPTATPRPVPSITPIPTSALYQVQSGDTLQTIADHFGVALAEIVEINNLSDPNAIYIGQTLMIPKVR